MQPGIIPSIKGSSRFENLSVATTAHVYASALSMHMNSSEGESYMTILMSRIQHQLVRLERW